MPDVTSTEVGLHAITLTANTVRTVTFADDLPSVDVISDGVADLYYTLDGSDPTVAGKNCYRIPSFAPGVDTRYPPTAGGTTVKLISTGTPTISVQRGT